MRNRPTNHRLLVKKTQKSVEDFADEKPQNKVQKKEGAKVREWNSAYLVQSVRRYHVNHVDAIMYKVEEVFFESTLSAGAN